MPRAIIFTTQIGQSPSNSDLVGPSSKKTRPQFYIQNFLLHRTTLEGWHDYFWTKRSGSNTF